MWWWNPHGCPKHIPLTQLSDAGICRPPLSFGTPWVQRKCFNGGRVPLRSDSHATWKSRIGVCQMWYYNLQMATQIGKTMTGTLWTECMEPSSYIISSVPILDGTCLSLSHREIKCDTVYYIYVLYRFKIPTMNYIVAVLVFFLAC